MSERIAAAVASRATVYVKETVEAERKAHEAEEARMLREFEAEKKQLMQDFEAKTDRLQADYQTRLRDVVRQRQAMPSHEEIRRIKAGCDAKIADIRAEHEAELEEVRRTTAAQVKAELGEQNEREVTRRVGQGIEASYAELAELRQLTKDLGDQNDKQNCLMLEQCEKMRQKDAVIQAWIAENNKLRAECEKLKAHRPK